MSITTPAAASSTPPTTTLTPPAPGDLWLEQAAWYAGPVAYPDGRIYALLLPEDFDRLGSRKWGKYGKGVAGAESLHDGVANTAAMAAAGSPLAVEILALEEALYLPSRIEALQLFATLRERIGAGSIWTSTQYSARYAWYQNFGDGSQHINDKDCQLRAVAVRRLLLHSFNPSVS